MDKEYTFLKQKMDELINNGLFIVKDKEIVFPIHNDDNLYIYTTGDKYRVLLPHPIKRNKKIHVGYFDSFRLAKKIRNAVLKVLNKKMIRKLIEKETNR